MVAKGLAPDYPASALNQLAEIRGPAESVAGIHRDLTALPWCSIDNDDSMDLDQLTVVGPQDGETTKVYVAVADVDALVHQGSPLDLHAKNNTKTVYTGVKTFAMLPEKLSTDLTSLSPGERRLALVIEMNVHKDGQVLASTIYQAQVKNQAQLAYPSVAKWLEAKGPLPGAAQKVSGMEDQLRRQDQVAQSLRRLRYQHGALDLETIEPRALMQNGVVVALHQEPQNRAQELIEDFMIAANGVTAKFLSQAGWPTLRRVVRSPERWARIVEVAREYHVELPKEADSKALSQFLSQRRSADPLRFPDLSLAIVKLLGRGEYVLEMPGDGKSGHFGLAVRDYTHSTAPNRRYPDLLTQRLLKAAMANRPVPYGIDELAALARHCTTQEDAADKVERQVRKSASALFLEDRIGQYFNGLVTGAAGKGTWARVFDPPVEGKIVQGQQGLEVGDKVRLKLIKVDVERGFIDFVRAEGH